MEQKTDPNQQVGQVGQVANVNLQKRQPKLFIVTGKKGVGKTYRSEMEVDQYCKSDPQNGRDGRPVLILDVNNEYKRYHTVDFDVEEEDDYKRGGSIRSIIQPIPRRIIPYTKGMKNMNLDQLKLTCITMANNFRGGLLLVEDINKFIVNTKKTDIVGLFVGLRHVGLDVQIHLQSIAKITPEMWENVNIIRMHHQNDPVDRLENRGIQFEIIKIAQIIVNKQYESGNKYYFCWIDYENQKLLNVTRGQLEDALQYYLALHEKDITTMMKIMDRTSGDYMYKTRKDALDAWYAQKMHYITF